MSMVLTWRYHKRSDSFEIVKLKGKHTCTNTYIHKKNHHRLNIKFIASMVVTFVQDNLAYIVSNIQEIKLHYKFKISYYKVWAAKQKILKELFGTHGDFFEMLSRLFVALQEQNPRKVVEWKHNG
jgi:hypothetical protein